LLDTQPENTGLKMPGTGVLRRLSVLAKARWSGVGRAAAAERHLFGDINRSESGKYHLGPYRRPMIEAFFAGQIARDLAYDGPPALYRYAVDELAGLLGSDARKHLRPPAASGWSENPSVQGSYFDARVGYASARGPPERRFVIKGNSSCFRSVCITECTFHGTFCHALNSRCWVRRSRRADRSVLRHG